MVVCKSYTIGQLSQATILAKDVVKSFPKRLYFSGTVSRPILSPAIVGFYKSCTTYR